MVAGDRAQQRIELAVCPAREAGRDIRAQSTGEDHPPERVVPRGLRRSTERSQGRRPMLRRQRLERAGELTDIMQCRQEDQRAAPIGRQSTGKIRKVEKSVKNCSDIQQVSDQRVSSRAWAAVRACLAPKASESDHVR